MKRVFAYLRVSTATQQDGDGYDRQLAACKRLAESKGWTVSRVFQEQESGSVDSLDRPRLLEALSLCGGEAGYDTLIVERVDRIARDLIVAELFFRECQRRGVKVYAADTGEELVSADGDPTRKLIRQILGALAEWDKSQLCRKLQSGRRKRASETNAPCGGTYAYGNSPDPVVRRQQQVFLRYILKLSQSGLTLREVQKQLFSDKIPNPRGGPVWQVSTLGNIIAKNRNRTEFDALRT